MQLTLPIRDPNKVDATNSDENCISAGANDGRGLSHTLLVSGRDGQLFGSPAFSANRDIPIHRWVPWIAGFSASFVEDCVQCFLPTKDKGLVLDPFAGVGTTLISAMRAGHDAVGFEINPYAAMASQSKTEAIDLDVKTFDAVLVRYYHASRNGNREAHGRAPRGFVSRLPFFSPKVEVQVHGFFKFLDTIENEQVRNLFKVAFGSVMVSFSNYTYEPSLGTRPGAGKPLIEDADVHGIVLEKLQKMLSDTVWLQKSMRADRRVTGRVHLRSFMDAPRTLTRGGVDLAVTSPPYLNNYHYIRSTRPHLYWLGLLTDRADIRKLEQDNIGKYWQTVRSGDPIHLAFADADLEDVISRIRETRTDKGVYGGRGWANYASAYFNDSARFLNALSFVIRPGGVAVIVIGNSIIQGHEIKVEQVLGRMGKAFGFDLEHIEILRNKRVGASITKSAVRRGEMSNASLYESAIVLRRERA